MKEIVTKLTQEMDPVGMVVIVSIPGMGKTQVAIRVGRDLLKGTESITVKKKLFSLGEKKPHGALCRNHSPYKRSFSIGKSRSRLHSEG